MNSESPHTPDEVLERRAEALAFFDERVHAVRLEQWGVRGVSEQG
ncbi:hypothetical protein [Streptomyces sp. NWU339]|nr:hypothetical protein [Streptomyces sp. NWU339]